MQKLMTIMMIVASIALAEAVHDASAEELPGQQSQDMASATAGACADTHKPMLSPSGTTACVFPESVLFLEKRGFVYVGEPFDMFPIKSFGVLSGSSESSHGSDPVISMSRMPSINETAVVEITYTNTLRYNVTDTEEYRDFYGFVTGWRVSDGFEVLDSDGLEYDTVYVGGANWTLASYTAFTPLDSGESITYRLEIRAVSEGHAAVGGLGYFTSASSINLYLDEDEALFLHEHATKYPELYERPAVPKSDARTLIPPLTDEELKNVPAGEPPSRELLIDFFAAYFADIDPDQEIGTSLDFVQQVSALSNLNMTDIRQILRDGGYTDAEIDAELSRRVSASAAVQTDMAPFVTTWQTKTAGESITIPVGGAPGTYTIDWGDGTVYADVSGDQTHAYSVAGDHTVRISGDFTRIHLDGHAQADKLLSIDQWGDTRWTSMNSAFEGAVNMEYGAYDVPNLSAVTDMSQMLRHAHFFDGDMSGWDVSSVTDMSQMFDEASSFSSNISGWDVSSVTNMSGMFQQAGYGVDISGWDVSSVTDMSQMFHSLIFDVDISDWDVSSVKDMRGMFDGASSFDGDISAWDTSSVTDMSQMFQHARSFDGDISAWDVSSVASMYWMFEGARSFDGDISAWDVSSRGQHGEHVSRCLLLQQRHIRLGHLVCNRHASDVS